MTRAEADAALEQIVRFLDLMNIDPPTSPRLEATDGIRGNPEWEIHVRTAPEDTPSGPKFDKAVAALVQIDELGRDLGFRPASSLLSTILVGDRTVSQ
jgi:hypothetical protein